MPTHTRTHARSGGLAGRLVALVADVFAFVIVLWIVLYLLDANQGNQVVDFVHDAATWLAGWSHDIFTFSQEWLNVVIGYGLAAVVYLIAGHALARLLSRF
ncbi:hypothetical protein ACFWBN_33765 [Streptomyces sp. NPDC059989]|uniref:hypothetical protein n=1 Tax=Streptomyces sp. NPDC059989 TaxID=3347026 RepID=UPI00369FDC9A